MENLKGIMVHYVTANALDALKEQVEKSITNFKHIFHITTERVGSEILLNPISEGPVNQSIL